MLTCCSISYSRHVNRMSNNLHFFPFVSHFLVNIGLFLRCSGQHSKTSIYSRLSYLIIFFSALILILLICQLCFTFDGSFINTLAVVFLSFVSVR